MSRVQTIATLLLVAGLLAGSTGCAKPSGSSSGYYSRGSIHRDSFPPDYVPGRYGPYGRPGRY